MTAKSGKEVLVVYLRCRIPKDGNHGHRSGFKPLYSCAKPLR